MKLLESNVADYDSIDTICSEWGYEVMDSDEEEGTWLIYKKGWDDDISLAPSFNDLTNELEELEGFKWIYNDTDNASIVCWNKDMLRESGFQICSKRARKMDEASVVVEFTEGEINVINEVLKNKKYELKIDPIERGTGKRPHYFKFECDGQSVEITKLGDNKVSLFIESTAYWAEEVDKMLKTIEYTRFYADRLESLRIFLKTTISLCKNRSAMGSDLYDLYIA
ncbi:MAG: hypothetical protein MJZ34_06845 [Paludibacteraceae bacterium]|nr:hypothetical protein [Paludibacteraceae bacterium]